MRPIDADRLKESVHAFGIRGAGWGDDERESDVCNMIDNEPTIDAAPVVHAKWVVNTDDFTPKKRCTNCGYNKPMKAGDGIEQEPEAFCPSCGATMDENGGNSQ